MNPKVLITGTRHSGTTFLMQLAIGCGLDPGDDLHSISPRQGLEWEPWRAMASKISLAYGAKLEPAPGWADINPNTRGTVRMKYGPLIRDLDFPEVVKFPEQGQACVLDMIRPGHVIVAVRDPDGWYQSMHYQNGPAKKMGRRDLLNGMTTKIGRIISELEAAELPYTVVSYPRSARVKGYTITKLEPILGSQLGDVWERTVNARWDRHRS